MLKQASKQAIILNKEFIKLLIELCEKFKITLNMIEMMKIDKVCKMRRGKSITKKEITNGNIPVIAGGQKPAYYVNQHNREGETIVVAGSGAAGYISYWDSPIFVSDAFSIEPYDMLNTKYVFYYLKHKQDYIYSLKKGAGVPHVYIDDISRLKIPVPPIEVQKYVVGILDKFSKYTNDANDGLLKEINLRKKEYEYYRGKLLDFRK